MSERPLIIYNSLTRKKEEFVPEVEGFVGMYVCGPTVYSNVHLGNCRTFVNFDLVYRFLTYLGYNVRYVRNITDAGHLESDADEGEDKIAKRAKVEQLEPMELVQKYTRYFHSILDTLNVIPPSIEPTATGHIVEQIDMIQEIMAQGFAYESNGSVYFDVKKYNDEYGYGGLSGRNIDEMISGTRDDLAGSQEKGYALDFALWKKASPSHIMQWTSPWGKGFPGWHLECSVMSSKYLGTTFDIHGGGMDLKFPHHECEIAQSTVAHRSTPVKYWMHANMLTLNGAKMSKSTGNFLTPEELFKGNNALFTESFSPGEVRYFMLTAQYRSTLDFSAHALEAAAKNYQKLSTLRTLLSQKSTFGEEDILDDLKRVKNDILESFKDDFNTPKAMAAMQEWFVLAKKMDLLNAVSLHQFSLDVEEICGEILGLPWEDQCATSGDSEREDALINLLVKERDEAKQSRNFEKADMLRDALAQMGITLRDGKEGTKWEK